MWWVEGAEAILKLRGVFLDELWDDFWSSGAQRKKKWPCAVHAGLRREEGRITKLQAAAWYTATMKPPRTLRKQPPHVRAV